MAALRLFPPKPFRLHFDRINYKEPAEQQADLDRSTAVYVGNLSFFTTESQIHALFSRCGTIVRVIMGLNRISRTPCGFCFVECV